VTSHIREKEEHSPIGASGAKRWMACPGSVKLSEGLPNEGTIYSATGTIAHKMAEIWLKTGVYSDGTMDNYIGQSFVEDGFEIKVTDEMIENVEIYKNAVWKYLFQYELKHRHDLRIEVGVSLPHIDEQAFGTCDAMIVVPMNRLIVIDYKNGREVVEVEDNEQLMYYALGAYYALPESDRSDLIFVEMVIVQPNASHVSGPVRRHVIRVEVLLEFEARLEAAVKRIRSGDTSIQSGSHCRWCPARTICPEARNRMSSKAGVDFAAIETAPVKLPPVQTLTPERLSRLMDNAREIKSWCNDIEDMGFKLAKSGTEIPGYKLVETQGNRAWSNPAVVEKRYKDEFGDEIYKIVKELKTPAALEKVLKKRKSEIAEFVVKPITGTKLVPISDARGAVGAVGDGFSAVGDLDV
jgi:hypothetical protein